MTDTTLDLGDAGIFEGKPVTEVKIEVRNISGGLNKAMPIAPIVLKQGDRAFLCAEIVTEKIRHEGVEKDDPDGAQARVQIVDALKTGIAEGTLVDAISDFLDAQQGKVDEYEASVEREQAAIKAKAQAESKSRKEREKLEASGQQTIESTGVGTEAVVVPTDKAKKVEKSTAAVKRAGRQVTPRPKKTTAKKAPAKKRTRKATH